MKIDSDHGPWVNAVTEGSTKAPDEPIGSSNPAWGDKKLPGGSDVLA